MLNAGGGPGFFQQVLASQEPVVTRDERGMRVWFAGEPTVVRASDGRATEPPTFVTAVEERPGHGAIVSVWDREVMLAAGDYASFFDHMSRLTVPHIETIDGGGRRTWYAGTVGSEAVGPDAAWRPPAEDRVRRPLILRNGGLKQLRRFRDELPAVGPATLAGDGEQWVRGNHQWIRKALRLTGDDRMLTVESVAMIREIAALADEASDPRMSYTLEVDPEQLRVIQGQPLCASCRADLRARVASWSEGTPSCLPCAADGARRSREWQRQWAADHPVPAPSRPSYQPPPPQRPADESVLPFIVGAIVGSHIRRG